MTAGCAADGSTPALLTADQARYVPTAPAARSTVGCCCALATAGIIAGGVARIRCSGRFIIVLLRDFVGRRLWRYRWEGAMNIVVAYCGPDAQLQGSVLRLRKRSADLSADDFAPPPNGRVVCISVRNGRAQDRVFWMPRVRC